ncbi:uncharacterized protein LY89DRAFT_689896 [Mollisia scopiformis]|uniref:Uncharacterized protein n=1 Tax=Mollisia scopiformis TaxID=149040 RepID=A0A132BED5_MOLSC|nr:uncharacterized protein LY89DRAFT_689896 [Mollisia scopiformis]KUJ10037.1 hypothetical protein LY89DRAFT_689896 [Mollisia scopiformis]
MTPAPENMLASALHLASSSIGRLHSVTYFPLPSSTSHPNTHTRSLNALLTNLICRPGAIRYLPTSSSFTQQTTDELKGAHTFNTDTQTLLKSKKYIPPISTSRPLSMETQANDEEGSSISKSLGLENVYPLGLIGKLPLELRLQLYELLLVNPMLAKPESISRDKDFGALVRYDLHPAILRTCRRIHEEATPTLYSNNTFFISFAPCSSWIYDLKNMSLCPLTRYMACAYDPPRKCYPTNGTISCFGQVKKWRVLLSRAVGRLFDNEYQAAFTFSRFCSLISVTTQKSIEIILIPASQRLGEVHMDEKWYQSTNIVLRPIGLLKGVEILTFRHSKREDFDGNSPQGIITRLDRDLPSTNTLISLRSLAIGESPVESPSRLWESLIRYARVFEPNPMYAQEMDRNVLDIYLAIYRSTPNASLEKIHTPQSSFILGEHPVEIALWQARVAAESLDGIRFKQERDVVVTYLEQQFRTILAAHIRVRNYIERRQFAGMLFDAGALVPRNETESRIMSQKLYIPTALLEEYARSLVRDMAPDVYENYAVYHLDMQQCPEDFDNSERQISTKKLHEALALGDWEKSKLEFRSACDAMDKRFETVIEARHNLFSADVTGDHQCEVVVDKEVYAGSIDWEKNKVGESEVQDDEDIDF